MTHEDPGALDDAVRQRRQALRQAPFPPDDQAPPDDAPLWGLALSGGGIRSATFCLGVLRALAAQGLLLRFDLLSTVSGGGYIGGMLGRLFDRVRSGADLLRVNRALAQAESTHFGWWLRANGRYLTPAGAADTLFALALYLRNLVGIHVEFGILAMLLGLGLCAVDLAVWQSLATGGDAIPGVFDRIEWLQPWLPTLWPLALLVLPVALYHLMAYWQLPWARAARTGGLLLGTAASLLVIGAPVVLLLALTHLQVVRPEERPWLAPAIAALLSVVSLASIPGARFVAGGPKGPVGAARNALTRRLSACLTVLGVCLGLGVVERLAWQLAFESLATLNLGLALGVVVVGLRTAAPVFAAEGHSTPPLLRAAGLWLLRALGYAMSACLAIWWTALVMKVVLAPVFVRDAIGAAGNARAVMELDFGSGWIHLVLMALPLLCYALVTGRNVEFLNLSSLHTFYAARLIRAYLGAANGERFSPGVCALDPIDGAQRTDTPDRSVGEVHPDDDVALGAYAPHRGGGPVHIVNTCVNQSAAARGRLFNRDRKGLLLSVMAGGASQLGQEGWKRVAGIGRLSLGTWLAISGAAVAPGLGARTHRGLSALLTFAGLRLGYWLTRAAREDARPRKPAWKPRLDKSAGLLSETFGLFAAAGDNDWLVSDGGHIENTGAYALLAARAGFILVADCGADPGYAFGDLENLVRKARIDLDTRITFQKPVVPPPADHDALRYFGSLNDLTSAESTACLALATVAYPPGPDGRELVTGVLIVIKPNMCAGLPMDIENYRMQCPAFPQQPTSDQFFNEAQWESYFSLGSFLAGRLDREFVQAVTAEPGRWFAPDALPRKDAAPEPGKASHDGAKPASGPAAGRVPARIGIAAVGATLSIGAVATVGVSLWQAADGARASVKERIDGERTAMKELADLWARLPAPAAAQAPPTNEARAATSAMAAAIVRAADAYCRRDEARWLQDSPVGVRMVRDTSELCWQQGTGMSQSCRVLLGSSNGPRPSLYPSCLALKPESPTPRYWGYDYSAEGAWNALHPCSTRRDEMVKAEENFERDAAGPSRGAPIGSTVKANDAISASALADVRVKCPSAAATAGATSGPAPAAPAVAAAPAVPTPAPPASGAVPATSVPGSAALPWNLASTVCRGTTIYVQIYGPSERDAVRGLRDWWRAWGASVPPIEDVLDSARRSGRLDPTPVPRSVLRYHDDAAQPCAEAIAGSVDRGFGGAGGPGWKAEALGKGLKRTPGVIELWVPPGDDALRKMDEARKAVPPGAVPAAR